MAPFLTQSDLKDKLLKSMVSEPYWALVFYRNYQDAPWAAEIFLKAVELDPKGAFYFFSARTGFNGDHEVAWYEERIPGLTALLRKHVDTAVNNDLRNEAIQFLVREYKFPERDYLLQLLVPYER